MSLTVTVTEYCDQEGNSSFTFSPAVCHLQCQVPALNLRAELEAVNNVASTGARLLMSVSGTETTHVPVLAYTLIPNIVFGEPGGEMTSALVSLLLNHGFQMAFSAQYRDILQRAVPARSTCTCTLGEGGVVQLHVDGLLMCSQQLDQGSPNDAAWLQAALGGRVLVISGDNIRFTDTDLELAAAARLGTLVTGIVPSSW